MFDKLGAIFGKYEANITTTSTTTTTTTESNECYLGMLEFGLLIEIDARLNPISAMDTFQQKMQQSIIDNTDGVSAAEVNYSLEEQSGSKNRNVKQFATSISFEMTLDSKFDVKLFKKAIKGEIVRFTTQKEHDFIQVASSMSLLDSYAVKCSSDATYTSSTATSTSSSFKSFEGDSLLEITFVASLTVDENAAKEDIRSHFMNILPSPVVTLEHKSGLDYDVTARQALGQLPDNLLGNIAKSIYDILPGLEMMGVSAWSDTVSVDFDRQSTTTYSTQAISTTSRTTAALKSIETKSENEMIYLRLKLEHLYIETKEFHSHMRTVTSVLADQLRMFYKNPATILATNTKPIAQEDFSSGFEVNLIFMILFNEDDWNSNSFDASLLGDLLQSGASALNQQSDHFYIVEDSFSLELNGPDTITLDKIENVLPKRGFYNTQNIKTTPTAPTTTANQSVFTRLIFSSPKTYTSMPSKTITKTSTTTTTATIAAATTTTSTTTTTIATTTTTTSTTTTTTSTTSTTTRTTTSSPESLITRHFIILDILYKYLESDVVEESDVWRILDGLFEAIELEYSDIARLLILEEGDYDKYSYSIVITTKSSSALPVSTLRSYFQKALSSYQSVKGLDIRYQGGLTQSLSGEEQMTTLDAEVQIDLASPNDLSDFDAVISLVWDALQSLTGQLTLYQITDLIPVDERTIRVHVSFDVSVMENTPDDDVKRLISYEIEFITQYAGLEVADLIVENLAVLGVSPQNIEADYMTSTTTSAASRSRTTPAPKTPSVMKLLQEHVRMYESKSAKKSKKKAAYPIQIEIPGAQDVAGNEILVQIAFEAMLKKKIINKRLQNVSRPYQGPTQESSIPKMTLLSVGLLTDDGLWSATIKVQLGSENQSISDIDTILNARMITEKLFPTGPVTKLN